MSFVGEAKEMLIHHLDLKDVTLGIQRPQNKEFWRVFGECYKESLRPLTRQTAGDLLDFMERLNLQDHRIELIEALLVYRGMEQCLDSSFSLHIVTDPRYLVDDKYFSVQEIKKAARKLECESMVDRIKWINGSN